MQNYLFELIILISYIFMPYIDRYVCVIVHHMYTYKYMHPHTSMRAHTHNTYTHTHHTDQI